MSDKSRNLIAIIVGTIAVVIVVAVIVLASIRITPFNYKNGNDEDWIGSYDKVDMYYGGSLLSGENEDGKITGNGDKSGVYSYGELFDMMGFSSFTACLQVNYNYGLTLEDETNVKNNAITVKDLKTVITAATGSDSEGYTFIISLSDTKTLKLKDNRGVYVGEQNTDGSYVYPEYDTVMFHISERSDWVTSVTAYAYMNSDITQESDSVGADTKVYYKLKFGCRTHELMETLDAIYGIESDITEEESDSASSETDSETNA